jgi:hypothetical protein
MAWSVQEHRRDVDALVTAATEVGIPKDAVRRAITVEQLGARPDQHSLVLGPAVVLVDEELPGEAADALSALDRWLVGGHHMRRDRLHATTGTWTRRRGVLGSTFRSLRRVTGEGYLGDLQRIDFVGLDTGAGTCVVRRAGDRRPSSRAARPRGAAGCCSSRRRR